ncbi:MarR family winged helix-turn-helix transcriptional regulator [Tomitella fengzijianii]|uniref:MarR family transcriptional regulator n=1 Tax=Tomitella fengzijianii TaxID=2597660 RepID=A0A516X659_9ACTN|nr:MarR family transcriptional regulator [Tomitella fengzijianii]QDQ98530.1 MarR family transcriptional regulator [Tomitella fengzijianii]
MDDRAEQPGRRDGKVRHSTGPAETPGPRAGEGSDDILARLAPVSHAIFRVARLHKTLAGQLLREVGMYPNQELVMMRLWAEGPQRQVDLVRMLESEAPTMTRTIKRLEKAGLVRTSRSPEDGRVVIVEATGQSRALRAEVERAWSTLEASTIGEWTAGQRTAALDALAALEANLTEAPITRGGEDATAQESPDPVADRAGRRS